MNTITITQAGRLLAISNLGFDMLTVRGGRYGAVIEDRRNGNGQFKPTSGKEIDLGWQNALESACDADANDEAFESEVRFFEKELRMKKKGAYWRNLIEKDYGLSVEK